MEEITAIIKKIIYNKNGFCKIIFKLDESFTAVGNHETIDKYIGFEATITGAWNNHEQYGKQFKFNKIVINIPKGDNIERYLCEIEGIGPVTAKKIYEKFGDNLFNIVDNNFAEIEDLIGGKKSKSLLCNWENRKIDLLSQYDLAGLGIPYKEIKKITMIAAGKMWKNKHIIPIPKIDYKVAPYFLVKYGISLDYIDAIAKKFNCKDNVLRFCAKYYIKIDEAESDGDCYITCDTDIIFDPEFEIIVANGRMMKKSLYEAEMYIAEKLTKNYPILRHDIEISDNLAPEQILAIKAIVENNVSIITGGPGTGKSYIIKYIIEQFSKSITGFKFKICAPTGKAAQNIACNMPDHKDHISTIHRLLYTMDNRFTDEPHASNIDMIIIDEMSMVDVYLFSALLKLIGDIKIVIIGDVDQLPSIGPGQLLCDLINSGKFHTTKLIKNFRQNNNISDIARSIIEGDIPEFTGRVEFVKSSNIANDVCQMFDVANSHTTQILSSLTTTVDAVNLKIAGHTDFAVNNKVMQIVNNYDINVFNGEIGFIEDIKYYSESGMCVMLVKFNDRDKFNKIDNEAINILDNNIFESMNSKNSKNILIENKNSIIESNTRNILNNKNRFDTSLVKYKIKITEDKKKYFEGDNVISIEKEQEFIHDKFINVEVIHVKSVPHTFYIELRMAYCATVHKFQGSEYPNVYITLQNSRVANRSNLYTAITRGKEYVKLIGDIATLKKILKKERVPRKTNIIDLIESFDT